MVEDAGRGRALIRLPVDADAVWGPKHRHHLRGTADGMKIRGSLQAVGEGWVLGIGAAWLRDHPVLAGHEVSVALEAEGLQTDDLASDIIAAFDSSPVAAAFFGELATFYRKGYLRWIDGASRRPDVRAQRIRDVVTYLEEGLKQRPR